MNMTINCDIMLGQATDSPADDDTAITATFKVVVPQALRTLADAAVVKIADILSEKVMKSLSDEFKFVAVTAATATATATTDDDDAGSHDGVDRDSSGDDSTVVPTDDDVEKNDVNCSKDLLESSVEEEQSVGEDDESVAELVAATLEIDMTDNYDDYEEVSALSQSMDLHWYTLCRIRQDFKKQNRYTTTPPLSILNNSLVVLN